MKGHYTKLYGIVAMYRKWGPVGPDTEEWGLVGPAFSIGSIESLFESKEAALKAAMAMHHHSDYAILELPVVNVVRKKGG